MTDQLNELVVPVKGEVRGIAVIRDKDGNYKGTFEFGGPITQGEFDELKDAAGPST